LIAKRERIQKIIAHQSVACCGLWIGNPHDDTWPILPRYFGTTISVELRQKLGDDFAWF
jgi:hypothetical protein